MIEQKKKSFAEKLSRTLDKLASVTTRDVETPRREILAPHPVYSLYPGYSHPGYHHPGYRTVRSPHGVNYHYVYGGWDPGVYGLPPASVEYMPAPVASPVQRAAAAGYCRCPDAGKDSMRSRSSSRCRRCHLERVYAASHNPHVNRKQSRPKLPMAPSPSPVEARSPAWEAAARRQRRPSPSPRDPYDYIRRTRLKAEEWDNYWEDCSSQEPRYYQQHPRQQSPYTKPNHGGGPPSPPNNNNTVHHPEDLGEIFDADLDHQYSGVGEPSPPPVSTTVLTEPTLMKSPMSDGGLPCEDEELPPESKPISELAEEVVSEPAADKSSNDPETSRSESPSSAPAIADEPTVFADLVSMKSRLSAVDLRYRKYQRRKPLRKVALQLEDVIIEENEDDLAAEDGGPISLAAVAVGSTDEAGERSGSDDELGLGKFKVVTTNFADEILSEIYGKTTDAVVTREPGSWRENSLSPRSLADEILEEIYGQTTTPPPAGPSEASLNVSDIRRSGPSERPPSPQVVEGRGLYRSISLQERGSGGLAHLLHDTTRFKLARRSSLVHLVPSLPPLPGTPTLHRPPHPPPPPPPPPTVIEANLQPFSPTELDRINSVIRRREIEDEDDLSSEFSDDEFDPVEFDYENLPLVRPEPEGAAAGSDYDIPELNESLEDIQVDLKQTFNEKFRLDAPPLFEKAEDNNSLAAAQFILDRSPGQDLTFDPNRSTDSMESRLLDISEDSLNIPKLCDTSFDRDSLSTVQEAGRDSIANTNSLLHETTELEEQEETSQQLRSVIHNEGEKTIILSPGMVASTASTTSSASQENRVYISSSSWINIEANKTMSAAATTTAAVMLSETNAPSSTEEPVKPPRLKKIARQQSKQELLRAKGFGGKQPEDLESPRLEAKPKIRPEISPPILINSTLNPVDLENHKCIPLSPSSATASTDEELSTTTTMTTFTEGVYRAEFSDSDGSFYTLESILDETYRAHSAASDLYNEHIYEEIPEARVRIRPLPPIPETAGAADGNNVVHQSGYSIFNGATKSEILHILNDAKLRIGGGNSTPSLADVDSASEEQYSSDGVFLGLRNNKHRISAISNISDTSNSSNDSCGESSVLWRGPLEKVVGGQVERHDSGVGSDSGISNCKLSSCHEGSGGSSAACCRDCDAVLTDEETLCSKCNKRLTERKEIISEIVETEVKYGNDLRIIMEEFYRPMLVAGLLSPEQLSNIFLNVEQLISVNNSFCSQLKEALDLASAAGDDDLSSVDIGSIFLDSLPMLQAFEAYCTKQAASSMLLSNLEREKELLRVFLKVSQMENKILRRMNLSSFLMVPVQRVTKYPLLLSRLLKVTPANHNDRERIKQASARIEAALDQMNKDAKELISMKGTWRRPAGGKKIPIQREMNNIRVRKLSLEMLGWGREDSRFAMEGKLVYAHITDTNWRSKWKGTVNSGLKLVTANALLVVTGKLSELPDMSAPMNIIFPMENVREAVLLLLREKTSRFSTLRDPFYLGRTIICNDTDSDCFEIQEFGSKDSYVFKAEDTSQTNTWFQTLQLYSRSLGGWRRRRRGLGNIMVDPGAH